ncbi:DUF2927 domain-containing protein [Gymnodinialimonas hymeniacidonis]|uniref:DUF2927 domain-containing protein n=1 Tax=Gymnodinialimonas hymeniacidonis TaxID=3126508 RepID=UPI0034C6B0E7
MRNPLRFVTPVVTLALAACVTAAPDTSPRPEIRAEAPPEVVEPSAESIAFARYYENTQARLIGNGLLRTDGGGPDTPFSARQLAQNFERIALYDEYTLENGRFVERQTSARLRRWSGPVRLQAHFGPTVDEAQQAEDRSVLGTFATRLARATGHPVRSVSSGGNFHVLYMNTDSLSNSGPLLRQLVPGISDATVREIETLGRFTFCSVYAFSAAGSSDYIAAIAVIRDEHPDLLRRSCVHEEVAQGLGLPNDSPAARPTIFNDDEEFALLTRHDELLLQMLYDRRLTPGLTPEEARPTVELIANELLGGPS